MRQPKEHPEKHLAALVVDGKEFLPAVALPLPLGGRSLEPGRDGEDAWADYAAEVLVPRWAVECIQKGLVLGQELEEDYNQDDEPFPVETMQDRVATILQTPGELDKWKRIVGWAIKVVRHLDLEKANKWQGGLVELLELGGLKSVPWKQRLAFSKNDGQAVAIFYWAAWAQAGWDIVERCFKHLGEMDDSCRRDVERLVAEGRTYWNRHPLTGEPMVLTDTTFNGCLFNGKKRWMNSHVGQMIECLTELLAPNEKRELDVQIIWLLFGSHVSFLSLYKENEEKCLALLAEGEAIRAQAEARAIEARVQEEKLKADLCRAKKNKAGEAEARQRAYELQAELTEAKRREEEWMAIAAKAKDELAKTKRSKKQYRQFRRKQKDDIQAAEMLDIARLLDEKKGGLTTKDAASKMGVSERTAERIAQKARKAGILPRRKAGRRKSIGAGDTIGGEGGEIAMAEECHRQWQEAKRND